MFRRSASKYGNQPTVVNGVAFASKAEARRYGELQLREKAGEITDLKVHPEFYLSVNGIEICKYIGDFGYWTRETDVKGKYILEDVKGVRTALYRLKKKLMLAVLAINITEVPVKGARWTTKRKRN